VAHKQFWLRPRRAGLVARFWADCELIHVAIGRLRTSSRPRPAYCVGFRSMWEASLAQAKELAISTDSFLGATSQIMIAQDTFTQAMNGAYGQ
jgi:hypothetical protein